MPSNSSPKSSSPKSSSSSPRSGSSLAAPVVGERWVHKREKFSVLIESVEGDVVSHVSDVMAGLIVRDHKVDTFLRNYKKVPD